MTKHISVRGSIKEAYYIIKPRFWTVVGQYALLSIVFFGLNALSMHNMLVSILLSVLSTFCVVTFSLAYAQKKTFSLDDLFEGLTFRKFAYYFLAFLLAGIAVFGGLILLIVPGVIIAVRASLIRYIAVERELKPVEAFRESFRLTKGHGWRILGFGFLTVLINILGALCLLVGLFYTLPLTMIAFTIFYKKLAGKDAPSEEVVETIIVEEVVLA